MMGRKKKKPVGDICKTLNTEFEQDWSVGLDATLRERQKIKNYFSSSRIFRRKPVVSYCWAPNVL